MIRGAIALGLAIKSDHYFQEYDFVVASVLALVISSTLLFGSFMPIVAKCLLAKPSPHKKTQPEVGDDTSAHEPMLDSAESPRFNHEKQFLSTNKDYHSMEHKASEGQDLRSGQNEVFVPGDSRRQQSFKLQKAESAAVFGATKGSSDSEGHLIF